MNRQRAVIIGAGYGGMALANLLDLAGYEVLVYEKNQHVGGRIYAQKQDGYTFDLGPSWYLMPEVFDSYYRIFGQSAAERLKLIRFKPGYKVFFDGQKKPLQIFGDLEKDAATFDSIEKGAGEKLRRYVARSTKVYELSLQHFLYTNFSKPLDLVKFDVIKNALGMLMLSIKSLDAEVSKYFNDIRLRQILEYHMVFLGSSPFQAPAIYSLMSHLDFISGVYYPKNGILSLATDMKQLRRGPKYHLSQPVEKIVVNDVGAASGVKLASGEFVPADIVVSNADLEFTETSLLEPAYQSYPKTYWHKRQPGPSAVLVSLGVRGEIPEFLHHNLYFVDEWRQNFADIYEDKQIPAKPSMYVCNPTKTDPSLAPDGCENLFILVPTPAGVEVDDSIKAKIEQLVITKLGQMIGDDKFSDRIESRLVKTDQYFSDVFNAWQGNAFGGESHLLSQSVIFRTKNRSKKVKNLFYVGAGTLPGVGLPMCLISAEQTYKRIIGSRKSGPLEAGDFKA